MELSPGLPVRRAHRLAHGSRLHLAHRLPDPSATLSSAGRAYRQCHTQIIDHKVAITIDSVSTYVRSHAPAGSKLVLMNVGVREEEGLSTSHFVYYRLHYQDEVRAFEYCGSTCRRGWALQSGLCHCAY